MTIFAAWLVSIVLSVFIAQRKGRSGTFWGLVSLLLGPIGTLIVLLAGKVREPVRFVAPSEEEIAAIHLTVGDRVRGLRASIELRDTGIAIHRDEGGRNMLVHGLKGEKRIGFGSITAVQLRLPTDALNGYIQFSILGGIEGRSGLVEAAGDENSVMFGSQEAAGMTALRNYVEQRMGEGRGASLSQPSVADELAKLADLWDRGILTDEEFAGKKAEVLGR